MFIKMKIFAAASLFALVQARKKRFRVVEPEQPSDEKISLGNGVAPATLADFDQLFSKGPCPDSIGMDSSEFTKL